MDLAWDSIEGGAALLRQLGGPPNFGDATIKSVELSLDVCRLLVVTATTGGEPGVDICFELSGLVSLRLTRDDGPDVLDSLSLRTVLGIPMPNSLEASWQSSSLVEIQLFPLSGLGGTLIAKSVRVN